jgi:hypothetical protein
MRVQECFVSRLGISCISEGPRISYDHVIIYVSLRLLEVVVADVVSKLSASNVTECIPEVAFMHLQNA